jgi:hypothetical protein
LQQNAALLRFDLSPIPADATILQAKLQVYATSWNGQTMALGAYCINRSVALCESTWMEAQTGDPWGVAGCNDTATDRRALPESIVTVSGASKWYTFDLTALVRDWVSGGVCNNGVLLRQTTPSYNLLGFASAEHGTATLRPKLSVAYYEAQ